MKTTYLDYYKIILEKVSFNPLLFAKEYLKAVNHLDADDTRRLKQWIEAKGLRRMNSPKHCVLNTGRTLEAVEERCSVRKMKY